MSLSLVPLKTRRVEDLKHANLPRLKVLTLACCGSLERGCQVRCHPHHFPRVPNCPSPIALALFQDAAQMSPHSLLVHPKHFETQFT
ncbi:hypothetical protein TNCV_2972341 [Trichonephila clavipes]|nr:hypothetical protein TNCV_2972341 [Trichonephila clavipes]